MKYVLKANHMEVTYQSKGDFFCFVLHVSILLYCSTKQLQSLWWRVQLSQSIPSILHFHCRALFNTNCAKEGGKKRKRKKTCALRSSSSIHQKIKNKNK